MSEERLEENPVFVINIHAQSSSNAVATRLLIKLLGSTLLRTHFSGTIIMLRHHRDPIFTIGRNGVKERLLRPAIDRFNDHGGVCPVIEALLPDLELEPERWVFFSNSPGLALRNLDHLIRPDSGRRGLTDFDLFWSEAPKSKDAFGSTLCSQGFWAVRGKHISLVVESWKQHRRKKRGDNSGDEIWTDFLRSLPLRTRPFEKGEVYAPRIGAVDWEALSSAAFITVPDWPEREQWKFLQAIYFGTYFGDETGLMMNILDP